jgi:hypothetical protein
VVVTFKHKHKDSCCDVAFPHRLIHYARLPTSSTFLFYTSHLSTVLPAQPCESPYCILKIVQLSSSVRFGRHNADYDDYPTVRAAASHQPTRPVDKEKTEAELAGNIKKATSAEETAPSECSPMRGLTGERAEARQEYVPRLPIAHMK